MMPQLHLRSVVGKHQSHPVSVSQTISVAPEETRVFLSILWMDAHQMMLQLTRPHTIVPQHFETQYTLRFLDAISED